MTPEERLVADFHGAGLTVVCIQWLIAGLIYSVPTFFPLAS